MGFLSFLGLVIVAYQLSKINTTMDAVNDLTSAVETLTNVVAAKMDAFSSALSELASDIQRVTSGSVSADAVEAEVAKLVDTTNSLASEADNVAKQIRDAIPTPAPETTPAE